MQKAVKNYYAFGQGKVYQCQSGVVWMQGESQRRQDGHSRSPSLSEKSFSWKSPVGVLNFTSPGATLDQVGRCNTPLGHWQWWCCNTKNTNPAVLFCKGTPGAQEAKPIWGRVWWWSTCFCSRTSHNWAGPSMRPDETAASGSRLARDTNLSACLPPLPLFYLPLPRLENKDGDREDENHGAEGNVELEHLRNRGWRVVN